MPYNKESAIAAQNAATAAATLLQGTGADIETFEAVRTAIFNGTLGLGGAEAVVEVFEGPAPAAVSTGTVAASYAPPTQVASSGAGEVTFNGGKHRDKSIAQVHAEDASYIEWAAEKMQNSFMQGKCREYLNSLQPA